MLSIVPGTEPKNFVTNNINGLYCYMWYQLINGYSKIIIYYIRHSILLIEFNKIYTCMYNAVLKQIFNLINNPKH